jgi:hypothetical protein
MKPVKAGRSKGSVGVPNVQLPAPILNDEEVDEAAKQLGMHGLKLGQLRNLRTLGQFTRDNGVVSTGRGMMLFSTSKLMSLGERVEAELDDDERDADPPTRARMMSVAKECWSEILNAGKILTESDESRQGAPMPFNRLPPPGGFVQAYNQTIKNTQINNTVHTNGTPILQPVRAGHD